MKTRIISGIVMGAIVAAILVVGFLWAPIVITLAVATLAIGAVYELLHNAAGIKSKASIIGAGVFTALFIFSMDGIVLELIAKILKDEGFIEDYKLEDKTLTLNLKYTAKKERVITGLKRISKPGLRVYAKHDEMPKVLSGFGIAIVSTSKGIMTDKEARKNALGGEVMAYIW